MQPGDEETAKDFKGTARDGERTARDTERQPETLRDSERQRAGGRKTAIRSPKEIRWERGRPRERGTSEVERRGLTQDIVLDYSI